MEGTGGLAFSERPQVIKQWEISMVSRPAASPNAETVKKSKQMPFGLLGLGGPTFSHAHKLGGSDDEEPKAGGAGDSDEDGEKIGADFFLFLFSTRCD